MGASDSITELLERIGQESFTEWRQERTFKKNIREGKPWRNSPSRIRPSRQHTASQLLKCHRKIFYRQLNAPEEEADTAGVLWAGSQIEEQLVLPYLEWLSDAEQYLRNSIWVEFTVSTAVGEIEIRGSTDPAIVDGESQPLLLSEVKTKRQFYNLDAPDTHHVAQAHAYLYGLSQKHDNQITDAVIIYVARKSLELRAFHVSFDEDFWEDRVVSWATTHSQYRLDEELPPADPEWDWECKFCAYQNRCGKGDADYTDIGPTGFLPLVDAYPQQKVETYLDAHANAGAKLTPTLAHQYPELVGQYEVYNWDCTCCSSTHPWDDVEWDGDVTAPPMCPHCKEEGVPALLRGPLPESQLDGSEEGER